MSDLPDLPLAPAAERIPVAATADAFAPPASAVARAAPTVTQLKFDVAEGATMAQPAATLAERVNKLYDLMPEELRAKTRVSGIGPAPTSGPGYPGDEATPYIEPPVAARGRVGLSAGGADPAAVLAAMGAGGATGAPQAGTSAAPVSSFLALSGDGLAWARRNASKAGLTVAPDGQLLLSETATGRRGAPTEEVVKPARRGLVAADDLPDLPVVGTRTSAAPAGDSLAGSIETGLSYTTPEGMPVGETAMEYSRASAALLNGVRRGLVEPPLAVAQMTLPRATMEPFEAKLRELETSTDYLRNEYPNIDMIGRLTGATVTIMAGARLLGAVGPMVLPALATKAAQSVWQGVGAVGRGAATGAAVNATNFYPAGPEDERRPFGVGARLFDTGVGAVLGTIGGTVIQSLEWGARNLADTALARSFMGLVQQTTNGTARNAGETQASALRYYEQVTQRSRQNYAVRNAAGREIEGFPTGVNAVETATPGFAQNIDRAVQSSKDEGVKSWVEGVARGVKKTLGVEREEARLAEWTRLNREYEAKTAALVPTSVPATQRAQMLERYKTAGGTVPEAPPPFVPRPTTPEEYAQARTEINAAINRAVRSKNNAVETQLKMMLRGIDSVAEGAARAEGVSTAAFVRQREAADKYFKETVVPLRKFFDGRSYERAVAPLEQGGISTAGVYDKIAGVVAKDDVELARSLGRVLGPRGRDSMVEVMAAEALRMGELKGEKSAIDYVMKHQNVIRELIGRDAFAELQGITKVAGTIAERVKTRSPKLFDWSHSVAPVFAISALMSGHYGHMAKIMMVLPAYHIGLAAAQRIHQTPIAKNLMRRAAHMKPGSAELEALVDRTERVIRGTTAVGTRTIGEESQSVQP